MSTGNDSFGDKRKLLEELQRLLISLKNDVKNWPDDFDRKYVREWPDKIDKLMEALKAENFEVSQEILTRFNEDAAKVSPNTRGESLSKRVKDIQQQFDSYRDACQ